MTILTPIFFWQFFIASITSGERSSGIIVHKNASKKRKINPMNGGGKGC